MFTLTVINVDNCCLVYVPMCCTEHGANKCYIRYTGKYPIIIRGNKKENIFSVLL